MDVSEKARRAVGAWPSPEALALRLVEAVEQGLAAAITEDERSRWRKLRDGMTGAGTAVLTNAAGSALGTAAIGGVGG